MPALTIRHVTTYRYRQPVAFGEHRMMLRPRDSQDQKVIDATLGITPEPISLRFDRDAFGNHVAVAQFAATATELSFESVVSIEHAPLDPADLARDEPMLALPIDYSSDDEPDLDGYRQRRYADRDDTVGAWIHAFLAAQPPVGAFELLTRLSQDIQRQFAYRRREAKGIQSPAETLKLGQGSCRDFAWLMIEAVRALGFAARFASGYLATASGGSHGATHAWAEVYLPQVGWIDFDPTSGSVGKSMLVTVAVVSDPADALPLHGTFIGSASDPLGMEVDVSVTPGCP